MSIQGSLNNMLFTAARLKLGKQAVTGLTETKEEMGKVAEATQEVAKATAAKPNLPPGVTEGMIESARRFEEQEIALEQRADAGDPEGRDSGHYARDHLRPHHGLYAVVGRFRHQLLCRKRRG